MKPGLPRTQLLVHRRVLLYRWSLIAEFEQGAGIVADRAGWAWTYAGAMRAGRRAMRRDAQSWR